MEKLEKPIILTDEQKTEEPLETALKLILYTYVYIIRAGHLAHAGFRIGDVVKELAAIAGDLEYWYPQLKNNGPYSSTYLWELGGHLNVMEIMKREGDKQR